MSQGGAGRHQRRSSQSVFDFPDDILQPPPMADHGVSDKEFGHSNSPNKIPEQHCKRPSIDVSTHSKEKSVAPSLPPTSQKK
ncbi:hypothetical protein L1987_34758 [Smallanthus sonchifolius]|uniref:Uncharacterized protein n=1 Tax=Smallanthus sonchifolius TaxID=185202 RepID=A0ACB9HWF2_9ASTR|nr:hypothetical protein L1987_34758 [Smallanthus sonchifolius]